jgi:hypothetical protein
MVRRGGRVNGRRRTSALRAGAVHQAVDTTIAQKLAAAVLIGIGGFVHFRIWQHAYRHAPVREMFVANWAASAVVVVLLVAVAVMGRRAPGSLVTVTLVAALALAAGSLAAFALSRGPGLPTLHGTFKEHGLETTPDYFFGLGSAKTVLAAEGLAAVLSIWLLVRKPFAAVR